MDRIKQSKIEKNSNWSRRKFVKNSALGLAGTGIGINTSDLLAQVKGERPTKNADQVKVLNPKGRVPISLIIDDSTCLVNMAYYGIPQFAEVFPERYQQDWRSLPREIPDSFVRKFGEWCQDKGVKGKYSIVPYPACVGWLDRYLPGWTQKELSDSINLVRELMYPNWDIHPEMISHTIAINTISGRPYETYSEEFMENWGFSVGKSVDELTDYMSYALKILKNIGLPCEGITTPGGFGNRVLDELSQATLESCREVFQAEIPHYFRHLFTDERSVAPRVEYASDLKSTDPKCVVSIIGCTGDWFGGWDGLNPGDVNKFITSDLEGGRLVEVIERDEPAVLVCHWPGIYFNGQELGFNIFKEIVRRLNLKYDYLVWMNLSEISRYWAAKELTEIRKTENYIDLQAPFSTPDFTLELTTSGNTNPIFNHKGVKIPLERIDHLSNLKAGKWIKGESSSKICFNLPKGESKILI